MILSPTLTFSVLSAVLVTSIEADGSIVVTLHVAVPVTGPSLGSLPLAVTVFEIDPLSTSDCLTTYVAVAVAISPGAISVLSRFPGIKSGRGSLIARLLTVTFPVFSTLMV